MSSTFYILAKKEPADRFGGFFCVYSTIVLIQMPLCTSQPPKIHLRILVHWERIKTVIMGNEVKLISAKTSGRLNTHIKQLSNRKVMNA